MTLIERLVAIAELWAAANNRSVATLSSRAINDGKLFDRLADGRTPTVATFDKLIGFLSTPANWRDGFIPDGAAQLLATIPPLDHAQADIGGEVALS